MRNETEDDLTEETTARQEAPERTLKEKIDELISEEAESFLDLIEDVPQEEMEESYTAEEVAEAFHEIERRVDALLTAAIGEGYDTKIALYVFQCVHDVVMPYYLARMQHASMVSSLLDATERLDQEARNNAEATLRDQATFYFQQTALLIARESSAV
jgi:hypothetical protein